jgi:hypothetical protein
VGTIREVRADILVVKTTIAEVDKAMAELSTQVQAQIEDVTAALEDKLTAVVDASGASAIYTLKTGVRINGIMYNAGMSIAVLAQAGQPIVTRVGFNANQFVLMSGSGDTQYSPFAVVNGQVFISSAFIQDGTITNAKIGNFIQSNNYVAGSVRDGGWINRDIRNYGDSWRGAMQINQQSVFVTPAITCCGSDGVMVMPQGLQCWDSAGRIAVDLTDYAIRYIGNTSVTFAAGETVKTFTFRV